MSEKGFNPADSRYKKVEDLPLEEQSNFVNTDDGFVLKSASDNFDDAIATAINHNKTRPLVEKLTGVNRRYPLQVLQEKALTDNQQFDIDQEQKRLTLRRQQEEAERIRSLERETLRLASQRRKREKQEQAEARSLSQKQIIAEKIANDIKVLPPLIAKLFNQRQRAAELIARYLGNDGMIRPLKAEPLAVGEFYKILLTIVGENFSAANAIEPTEKTPQLSIEILKAFLEGEPTNNFFKEPSVRPAGVVSFTRDYPTVSRRRKASLDEKDKEQTASDMGIRAED